MAALGAAEERHVQDFRELKVWQRAHELTLSIYRVTALFPAKSGSA